MDDLAAARSQVRLLGLYDDRRREELAEALIPVIQGECSSIDMSAVEHIDVAAVTSFLPLLKAQWKRGRPQVRVIGMNEDIKRTLQRTGLAGYFTEERRVKK
ncbi:MAG: hypothetical protein NVSMB31_04660 [Vulcanimicrobiaceae bacterium]